MRILVLNYEYPPLGGGAANATKYILREFSKYDDLEIDLVTSCVGEFKVEEVYDNVRIHYLDIGKNPSKLHSQSNKDLLVYSKKAYFYCKKLMKKEKFDLCHAFFGIPCGFIARRLKLPYIVSLRGSDVPFYSEKYELLDKLFFKRLSKRIWRDSKSVVANSTGLKDLALKSAPKQEIGVIYNGIDTDEFLAKQKYSKRGKLKVLCVGRLISRKGFEYVIDAATGLDVSVDIIGDGPLREELELRSAGIDVNFLGILEHDKLASLYRKYDVFCLASFNEGMSNTVLEAMAAGLALIVTDTGGTAELVSDNGFVVEVGDASGIARRFNMYLMDFGLLEEHGRRSRELALGMSWGKVAEAYYLLYRDVVGK